MHHISCLSQNGEDRIAVFGVSHVAPAAVRRPAAAAASRVAADANATMHGAVRLYGERSAAAVARADERVRKANIATRWSVGSLPRSYCPLNVTV